MLTTTEEFLGWARGVHRRVLRDLALLPPEAASWRPAATRDDETTWSVSHLVQHLAESRPYFAGAFNGRGWMWEPWHTTITEPAQWKPALEESFAILEEQIGGAPPEAMRAKIALIGDPDRTISAWRALMMMAEHDIHHRSQIATYAGLNGWPVAQLFEATNEWVRAQRDEQIRRNS